MTKPVQIYQSPDPILRAKTRGIVDKDIKSPSTMRVLNKMRAALEAEDDGVALAAPQIGESLRIFIVSPKAFLREDDLKSKNSKSNKDKNGLAGSDPAKLDKKDVEQKLNEISAKEKLVYINPVITRRSRETTELEEGCLSVRWLYGAVRRHTKATVRAYDEHGNVFSRGASGLLAQIFQHEIDHLDGILFIDKAKDLRELPPKKTT
jgi:peptide deformylase